MKVTDLRFLARQLGIRCYSRLRKDNLIDFIKDNLRSRAAPRPAPRTADPEGPPQAEGPVSGDLLQGQHLDLPQDQHLDLLQGQTLDRLNPDSHPLGLGQIDQDSQSC